MDRRFYFERNLLALSAHNPALCARLSGAETTLGRYRFLESRAGGIVPALVDHSGAAHPLHSIVDPKREGERLVSTLGDEGFLIFLGLGGGYAAEAALNRAGVSRVLVLEYDINGLAELFCGRDYISILDDSRFTLLVDAAPAAIEEYILEQYRPALSGGIRTFPLRTRTEQDTPRFNAAAEAIQRSIEKVSADYSVQAHFGTRWFSNIIRNLAAAERQCRSITPVREAAICAAGPSLDQQLPLLAESGETFIICADTALPALLRRGVTPHAVVSIDCQHISYQHFMGCGRRLPLFLEIASPPLLADFSDSPFFFAGGHPLAAYISQRWRSLPRLDTSGGNVTYACLSLAENLGAGRIRLYGADFSYPRGRVYARGTYLYPFFEKQQNRFAALEAQFSAFLYRSPFLAAKNGAEQGYYETAALRFYRRRFEEKAALMETEIIPVPGQGAPIHIRRKPGPRAGDRRLRLCAPGKARQSAAEFLEHYRRDILALPLPGEGRFGPDEAQVLTTLLPQAAALKRRRPELKPAELIDAVKQYCVDQIGRVLEGGAGNGEY